MQPLRSALYGLLAIAATTALAAADDRAPQEQAAKSAPMSADDAGNQNGARTLRPVTKGMRPQVALHAQAQEQLALAASKSAARSLKDMSVSKPSDIVIDVLVAYTKKAASNYADIKGQLVELSIDEANKSFRMSNLGHIKLRLVHAYQTDYVEDGEHFDHVWRFADKGDGYMEEVHGLRDTYRADVAVLIVDDPSGC